MIAVSEAGAYGMSRGTNLACPSAMVQRDWPTDPAIQVNWAYQKQNPISFAWLERVSPFQLATCHVTDGDVGTSNFRLSIYESRVRASSKLDVVRVLTKPSNRVDQARSCSSRQAHAANPSSD